MISTPTRSVAYNPPIPRSALAVGSLAFSLASSSGSGNWYSPWVRDAAISYLLAKDTFEILVGKSGNPGELRVEVYSKLKIAFGSPRGGLKRVSEDFWCEIHQSCSPRRPYPEIKSRDRPVKISTDYSEI